MKKLLLFALAALAVSVSQAVTVIWTAESILLRGAPSGEWTGAAILSGAADSSSWVTTNLGTVSWGSLGQNDTEKALTTTDSTGYQAGVMRKNIGTASGNYFNDVSFDITLDSALTAGDYTLVIFAPGYYNTYDKGFNYTTFTVEEGWEDLTISMGNLDLNTDLTDRAVTSTTVPEPTVLALLALGVAGVALRRRA